MTAPHGPGTGTHRWKVGLAAGGSVLAVATLLAWCTSTSPPEEPGAAGRPASVPTPARPGRPSSADPLPELSTSAIVPADLSWVEVGGIRLPCSARYGPWHTGHGLAAGFSADATGAVLAAAHILIRINPQLGPAVFRPTLAGQVVGPDADALRTRVEQGYQRLREQFGVTYGQPAGRLYATLRGFRVDQVSGADVWLHLLSEAPDGRGSTQLSAMLLQLRWTGRDWALVAPLGGAFTGLAGLVSSTESFTTFDESAPK
ncbi:MAG TPA: hypothetical protein VF163_21320 [Micromonosporaceae bacterium]